MSQAITFKSLRKFNLSMAALHGAQGVAILLLSRGFSLPVTGSYLLFNDTSKQLQPASAQLFNVSLPLLIALFLFISAAAHLFIGTIYNKTYNQNLGVGLNKVRWIEYALSASLMMVAISLLIGMYDFVSLVMVFALVAIMNLLGLVMEVHNQGATKPKWLSYWVGCLAGIVPWFAVIFYFALANNKGDGAPTFVYWIFVSIFIFFSCFAINMLLQYKKVGKWKDYLYGERTYIILSLVAKSLLAWQVFAGTLRP